MCEICSKLTIKTPERLRWRRSGVFIEYSEHILQIIIEFSLLTVKNKCRLGHGIIMIAGVPLGLIFVNTLQLP